MLSVWSPRRPFWSIVGGPPRWLCRHLVDVDVYVGNHLPFPYTVHIFSVCIFNHPEAHGRKLFKSALRPSRTSDTLRMRLICVCECVCLRFH